MATLQCHECIGNNRIGHTFCRNCGKKLVTDGLLRVRVLERYHGHEKFCGYCGKRRFLECKCDGRGRR